MFSYKFWLKIRNYANKKLKAKFLNKYKHDRRCPKCLTWLSETDGALEVISDETKLKEYIICKKCKTKTVWYLDSILPYSATFLDDIHWKE